MPLVLALVGAGGVFVLAGAMRNHGWLWADQLCQQGPLLCDHPGWILTGAGILVLGASIRAVAKT